MDYDCKSLLDKYKSSKLFEPVLNIVLVLKRLRQSTLFETGSFTKEECKEHRSICDSLPMIHIETDDFTFPRILVMLKYGIVHEILNADPNIINNDTWVGIFLGFMSPGGDYGNFYKNRITCHFMETTQNEAFSSETVVMDNNVFSEEEIKKRTSLKASEINHELQKIGYACKEKIEILIGCDERYEKLKNKDVPYVKDNFIFYLDDYENNYISDRDILLESDIHQRLKNVNTQNISLLRDHYYKTIMENDEFRDMYQETATHEDIKQVAINIRNLDSEWWREKDEKQNTQHAGSRYSRSKKRSRKKKRLFRH